jgi:hypothetical protein
MESRIRYYETARNRVWSHGPDKNEAVEFTFCKLLSPAEASY